MRIRATQDRLLQLAEIEQRPIASRRTLDAEPGFLRRIIGRNGYGKGRLCLLQGAIVSPERSNATIISANTSLGTQPRNTLGLNPEVRVRGCNSTGRCTGTW